MNGQTKEFDTYLDQVGLFVSSPTPYDSPKPLGFNLSKAIKYAKENKIKVSEIPLGVLKQL